MPRSVDLSCFAIFSSFIHNHIFFYLSFTSIVSPAFFFPWDHHLDHIEIWSKLLVLFSRHDLSYAWKTEKGFCFFHVSFTEIFSWRAIPLTRFLFFDFFTPSSTVWLWAFVCCPCKPWVMWLTFQFWWLMLSITSCFLFIPYFFLSIVIVIHSFLSETSSHAIN